MVEWLPGGSVRRGADKIGDLDVMVVTPTGTFEGFSFPPSFVPQRQKDRVAQGDFVVNNETIHLDFWVCAPHERGALLMFITGPKDLNIAQRAVALKRGYTLSQYGLFQGTVQLDDGTEEDIYSILGLDWIPPQKRQLYAAKVPDPKRPVEVFKVRSLTDSSKVYEVRNKGGVWSCNCPGYRFARGFPRTCKHIGAMQS